MIKAVKAGDWELVDGAPVAAGVTLAEGEYELRLVAADAEHSAPLPGGEGVVVLDTEVTPELAAEGLARDVVRVVQQARRDADLDVSDRIAVSRVGAPSEVRAAVAAYTGLRGPGGAGRRGRLRRRALDGFAGEVGDGERVTVAVRAGLSVTAARPSPAGGVPVQRPAGGLRRPARSADGASATVTPPVPRTTAGGPVPLLYTIGKLTVAPALRLAFRPHVEGLEHIPATGGAIFAGNHLSVADELFLGTVVPRHLAFWAKSEYFNGTGRQGRASPSSCSPGWARSRSSGPAAGRRCPRSTRRSRCSRPVTWSPSTRRAPARRTAGSTGAGPARPGWRSPPGCRSSRSA